MNIQTRHALIALILLLPIPSLGVYFGMIALPNTAIGQGLFFLMKSVLLIMPIFWTLAIDKQPLSWSKPQRGGFLTSGIIGVAISIGIVGAYLLLGQSLVDTSLIQSKMLDIGLASKGTYIFGATYWILVNAVLEEYVWRWFVVQQSEKIIGTTGAIFISAVGFTLHHIVAMQLYFNWVAVLLCAIGIFFGGAIWSWCYIKYRSIWPCYLSHAIVDVAIFGIGYQILFG